MNLRTTIVPFFLTGILAACGLPQPAPQSGAGLDSLTDDKLMNELAVRGLSNLLDRAFEVNKVPQSEQESRRAILALQTLTDPTKKLPAKDRQELVSKVAAGIEQVLPKMRDPETLLAQANVLIAEGVTRDVNTLEYWGENLTVMSQLRPIAQAVGKIFDRAAQLANDQLNALSAQANPNNAQLMGRLEKADQLQNLATYSARMNDYAIALSIDPADPQRAKIAEGAIAYLSTLDTEDQPVRPYVHVTIAKLNIVKGDYAAARKAFDDMLKPEFKPASGFGFSYEARYFRAVNEILDKKPDAAKKAMADLLAWQQKTPPPDPKLVGQMSAAASMLEYRIDSLQADMVADAKAKADF